MMPTADVELFPSVFKFDNSSDDYSMSSLLKSMKYIKSNISFSISVCYNRPWKAAKLKEYIQQGLIWILLYYRQLPKTQNSTAYFESMSDILAMYIDMELRALQRPTEQLSEITARIIYCLHVYLERSTEHMLDTLIKVRSMTSQFHLILDPVMKRLLEIKPKEKRAHPKTEMMYVRYLLAFRLWREINEAEAVRKEIVNTAVSFLEPMPFSFPKFLKKHIPRNRSRSQTISTNLFMEDKLFDVKVCCMDFMNFCKVRAEKSPVVRGKMNCLEREEDQQQKIYKMFPQLEQVKRHNFWLNNPRPKEGSGILGLNDISAAKAILESLIHVAGDSEQMKIETDLYSSFDSWIRVDNLQPTNDIHTFFVDELEKNSVSSLNINPNNTSTSELPAAILSSSAICTSKSALNISCDRLNSYDSDIAPNKTTSDEFAKDNPEEESLIKRASEISQVARIETSKSKCPSEADSMISDSNENSIEIPDTRIVCEEISTMILEDDSNYVESSNRSIRYPVSEGNFVNQYSRDSETPTVSFFKERIKESSPQDYSKAVDYTIGEDNTILPVNLTNVESSYNPETERRFYLVPETQFQKNVGNLSLLANVSQLVETQNDNSPSKTIKGTDYARLCYSSNNAPDSKIFYQSFENTSDLNRIGNINSEGFDRVALQAEVTSTYGIPDYSVMNSLSPNLANSQIPLHSPATHSTPSHTLPPMDGNSSSNSELCAPSSRIEKNLLESRPLEQIDVKFIREKEHQVEINNQLPLKKRLKAYDFSIEMEKSDSYPGTSMMSIANLDVRNDSELSNLPIYHDSHYQRSIKPSLPGEGVGVSPRQRLTGVHSLEEQPPKKTKKLSTVQIRSSQRNVPKVNYEDAELDPEWHPSGYMKRKKRKNAR